MKYSNMLSEAIQKSGLKLGKIVEKVSVITGDIPSREHLSRLQNGKTKPVDDALNGALAVVLGIDPLELRTAAYREKLPADVLERLQEAR